MADRRMTDFDPFLFDEEDAAPPAQASALAGPLQAGPLGASAGAGIGLVPPAISAMPEIDFGDFEAGAASLPMPTRIQLDWLSRALVEAALPGEAAPAEASPAMAAMERIEADPIIEAAAPPLDPAAGDAASQSAFDADPRVELTRPITEVGFRSEKVLAGESRTGVTTVDIGADGNLYSGDIFGNIVRYELDPDTGRASNAETIINVGGPITGMKFDPGSPAGDMDLWISYATTQGRYSSIVSEISIPANGPATEQRKITGLPYGDHQVNGLDFGPDGRLYIQAGGLASLGEFAPGAFADPEVPLSAALLVADVNNDPRFAGGPINVQANENGQGYDPFAPNAPVQIHATGLRNAYDIEWTRNTAGEAIAVAGINGNSLNEAQTPDDPSTAANENFFGIKPPEQFAVIEEGNYYGHPNPSRGEYILNGGNPTGGNDPWEIGRYAVGTQPEPGFDPSLILNIDRFGADSPNGIDTYIDGTILQTTFSGDRKILLMSVDGNNTPSYLGDLKNVNGGRIGFSSPLDVVTDPDTGRIYVANFGQRQSDPSNGAVFVLTPEAGAIRETGGAPEPVEPPTPDPVPEPDPDPVPEPEPAPQPEPTPPAGGDDGVQRIESDAFQNRVNYAPEAFAAASGNSVLALTGGALEGSVQARFSGESGTYDLELGYFDAPGAGGTISVYVNETALGTASLGGPGGNAQQTAIFDGVSLDPGNTIRFEVSVEAGEAGRLDYIELTPGEPAPEPAPQPDPAPRPDPVPEPAPDPAPDPVPPTDGDGATAVWRESFDELPDGARADTGETAWSTSTSATRAQPLFGVEAGEMVFSDATRVANEDDAFHTWRSEAIDIDGLSDVTLGFTLSATGGLEASGEARDFFRVYAVVDGERTELLARDGGPAASNEVFSLDGVPEGRSLVIEVAARTTVDAEAYRLDNVEVSGVRGPATGETPDDPGEPAPDQPVPRPLPISDPIAPDDGDMPDVADQLHLDDCFVSRVQSAQLNILLEAIDTFDFAELVDTVDDRMLARLGWEADWHPYSGVTGLDLDDFTEIA